MPPGNVAREYSLLARRMFALTGDWSALSLPTMAVLTARPGGMGPREARSFLPSLKEVWNGLEGPFIPEGILVHDGFLFQSLGGAFAGLLESISLKMDRFGESKAGPAAFPLPTGKGILLSALPGESAGYPEVPKGAFHSASLAILQFRFVTPRLSEAAWTELCRLPRPQARRDRTSCL